MLLDNVWEQSVLVWEQSVLSNLARIFDKLLVFRISSIVFILKFGYSEGCAGYDNMSILDSIVITIV